MRHNILSAFHKKVSHWEGKMGEKSHFKMNRKRRFMAYSGLNFPTILYTAQYKKQVLNPLSFNLSLNTYQHP